MTRERSTRRPAKLRQNSEADGYLAGLAARLRRARVRRGMTRKALSQETNISERYLAELEAGRGNASIALLRRIADAMNLSLAELVDDRAEAPVELDLIVERLRTLSPDELTEIRAFLNQRFANGAGRHGRIALIGLRGAGKSTLGQGLSRCLKLPFVQINEEIERDAGMSLEEIFNLLGQAAYRRWERRCLDRVIENYPRVVIEVGGGLVADTATFERLLSSCYTIWLQATPEDHMHRVVAQGDHRPMAGHREAMADLKRILLNRESLYSRADAVLNTSGDDSVHSLKMLVNLAQISLANAEST